MSVEVRKMKSGAWFWTLINSRGLRIGNSHNASSDKQHIVKQARMLADRLGAKLVIAR